MGCSPDGRLLPGCVQGAMKHTARHLLQRARAFGDRFTAQAQRELVAAASWLLCVLRGPEPELALDDRDIEVLTPRTIRRLETAVPTFAFPRRPLSEATVRRGWVHVEGATILGLGPALGPREIGGGGNVRALETAATEPFSWMR